jgi:hypothetical protein
MCEVEVAAFADEVASSQQETVEIPTEIAMSRRLAEAAGERLRRSLQAGGLLSGGPRVLRSAADPAILHTAQ